MENKLKTYLTFEPSTIFGPSIRHLSTLLVIAISFTYFLAINKQVAQQGFQVPDSVIDTALKFSGPQQIQSEELVIQPSLTSEQIELLKQNPDLLKQYGLDPKILDNINQPNKNNGSSITQNLIKQTVKDQLNSIINPYLGIIAPVLALFLFLTLQSFTSFLGLLIYPILWLLFIILEKTGFITFTTETRPVKKMVV